VGETEAVMIQDDGFHGVDDLIAEHAFARRALRRYKAAATDSRCRRRLNHPREPTQFDEYGFLVVDTCECLLLWSHGFEVGCICEHEIECPIYALEALDESIQDHHRRIDGL
jgi:hypothetical protein